MESKTMTAFRKTAETYTRGAKTLPQRFFTSSQVFAEERDRIFSTHWLCVGHQSQLANPGDYFAPEVVGESLVILRDRSGTIRGFYNVCRHRGSRLCESRQGRFRESLQCQYHAWTYGLDGSLIGAPHMTPSENFDRSQYSLHRVTLALWEGFLFINLSSAPEPFESAFAPLFGKFTHWNLAKLKPAKRIEYDVAAN
jgi:Rieske 2Fe-2S family protein